MNYKEEIMNALANVCKRARREGYAEGLKKGEDIEQLNAAEVARLKYNYGYKDGLDDAWKCAKKIVVDKTDGGIGIDAVIKSFGNLSAYEIFMNFTASEAIVLIKGRNKLPEKSRVDDEIKIGDEVDVPQLDCKGIVIATANKETILVLSEYMDGLLRTEKHKVKKTGRYFPEIADIKMKMQVDGRDNQQEGIDGK